MQKKLVLLVLLIGAPALAQNKAFSLHAPETLVDSGLLDYALPRFSLKKGIRISLINGVADARLGTEGTPVFRRDDTVWHFDGQISPYTDTFLEWLLSDVGKRTIEAFEPESGSSFSADIGADDTPEVMELTGDAVLGAQISLKKCGRCHVVSEGNRMKAIGSSPSFALMRSFPDWLERFEAFYFLRPHAAFTQVTDVTDPFPDNLPSPIAPIEVTLDEIEAITAYVGSIAPADLGAPLQAGGAFQSP